MHPGSLSAYVFCNFVTPAESNQTAVSELRNSAVDAGNRAARVGLGSSSVAADMYGGAAGATGACITWQYKIALFCLKYGFHNLVT